MKKRKRYDVRGMMEWHPVFRIGRTRMKVSFTGGHLCGGGCTPASFETADPVVQAVIEGSEAFRAGRIVIGSQSGVDDDRSRSREKPVRRGDDCVFEYSDIEEICDFLHFNKGIPLERFDSEESIFEEAARLGVTVRKKGASKS